MVTLQRLSDRVLASVESKQGIKAEGPSGNLVTLSTWPTYTYLSLPKPLFSFIVQWHYGFLSKFLCL